MYCFQKSRSSFESRASLPPALKRPPLFSDAINSGVGVGRLRPAPSPDALATEDWLVCELVSLREANDVSECRDVLEELAL